MSTFNRDRQFHLRLTPDEIAELHDVASRFDMSATSYVRHALGLQLEEDRKKAREKEDGPYCGALRKAQLAAWDAQMMLNKGRKK